MKVRMYNVEFGESILLDGETENLLVDFGSEKGDDTLLTKVADDIMRESAGKCIYSMLSHFHKDHINGFLKTNLSQSVEIKKLFIPSVVEMDTKGGRISCAQIEVLKDIFEAIILQKKGSGSKNPEITLYSLLKKIMDTKSHVRSVHFLKRGDSFFFENSRYDVLWPDFDHIKLHGKTVKKVIKVSEWLGIVQKSDGKDDGAEEKKISFRLVDEFIGAIVEVYKELAAQEESGDFSPESREEQYRDLMNEAAEKYEKIVQLIQEKALVLDDDQITELQAVVRSIGNNQNRISIVCHNIEAEDESRIMLTGDVENTDLELIVNNDPQLKVSMPIAERYAIIKAPHHGTDTHYIPTLPQSKYILTSNGGGNKAYHPIFHCYGGFYGANRGSIMKCTNRMDCTKYRCELYGLDAAGKGIRCPNCDDDQNEKKRNADLYLDIS